MNADDGMTIVACMPVRNEDWILDASIEVALSWCDGIVILDHNSTDDSKAIIAKWSLCNPLRVQVIESADDDWQEMEHRQAMLDAARRLGATHIALIDADEIVTASLIPTLRRLFAALSPAQCLDLPMIPVWNSLDNMRIDNCEWTRASITLGFMDHDSLLYAARDQGYQHHARKPRNSHRRILRPLRNSALGGVMHLQFADKRRITAKHAWYKMIERLRWPNRESVQQVDRKYNQALDETGMRLGEIPAEWWEHDPPVKDRIFMDGVPWQEAECRRMMDEHGPEMFRGLNLFGVV